MTRLRAAGLEDVELVAVIDGAAFFNWASSGLPRAERELAAILGPLWIGDGVAGMHHR